MYHTWPIMLHCIHVCISSMLMQVYDGGAVFDPKVLDITDDDLSKFVQQGIQRIAAACLALNYPTLASIPHSVVNGYKNVLAVAVETEYTFPLAEKVYTNAPDFGFYVQFLVTRPTYAVCLLLHLDMMVADILAQLYCVSGSYSCRHVWAKQLSIWSLVNATDCRNASCPCRSRHTWQTLQLLHLLHLKLHLVTLHPLRTRRKRSLLRRKKNLMRTWASLCLTRSIQGFNL